MIRTLKSLILSLFLAMWLEFFYKFGATYDPENFVGALIIYPFYIALLFVLFTVLRIKSKLMIIMASGFTGLMAEWFIIGNSPWSNPHAFQLGMYVFHALYPVYGYLSLKDRLLKKERRFIIRLFIGFTLISLCGFVIPDHDIRFMWFIFIPLMPYFIAVSRLLWMIFLDFRKKQS